jgi:hypothetical protein
MGSSGGLNANLLKDVVFMELAVQAQRCALPGIKGMDLASIRQEIGRVKGEDTHPCPTEMPTERVMQMLSGRPTVVCAFGRFTVQPEGSAERQI